MGYLNLRKEKNEIIKKKDKSSCDREEENDVVGVSSISRFQDDGGKMDLYKSMSETIDKTLHSGISHPNSFSNVGYLLFCLCSFSARVQKISNANAKNYFNFFMRV